MSFPRRHESPTIGQAMSNAACDLAEALQAKAILVPTFSGRTASAVARLRPRRPIVALTHVDWAMRQLALEWGVTPVMISETGDVEDLWRLAVDAAREAGIVETGDRVVITAGTAVNIPGSTNVIKVDSPSREAGAAPKVSAAMASRTSRRRRTPQRWAALVRIGALVLVGSSTTGRCTTTSAPARSAPQRLAAVTKLAREQARARAAAAATRRRLRRSPREARTLGYVRPGEHLFIVKDIPQWRRRQMRSRRGHRR